MAADWGWTAAIASSKTSWIWSPGLRQTALRWRLSAAAAEETSHDARRLLEGVKWVVVRSRHDWDLERESVKDMCSFV